jgi:EAL domain-containing protein (putative c-di-GMP-specific phosphodiesterase class I)
MDDVDLTARVVRTLQMLGVRVAIDDFGTGPTSLGSLARFPIDDVKIDRSIVLGIEDDPVKSAIVSATVGLARAFGSRTVVEGVETPTQLEVVERLGCDVAQGHHFARPMSATAFGKLLAVDTAAVADAPADHGLAREAQAG